MTLLRHEDIIIVIKATGTFHEGKYTEGTISYVTATANIQPLNDTELQMLKEGDRLRDAIKLYSETEIKEDYFIRRKSENIKKAVTCSINTVIDSTKYSCIVNDSTFTYDSGIGATAISIAAGLVSLITAGSELVSVVDNLDGTYTITSIVEGTDFNIRHDANQSHVIDIANVKKEYKAMKPRNWSVHSISHYKIIALLVEDKDGL